MPQKKKVFNLNAIEAEGGDEPFEVELGDRTYTLLDVKDMDINDIEDVHLKALAGNFRASVEMLVAEEDREDFFSNRLTPRKMEALMEAYNAHFGLPSPGEARASLL
jgi:hypothetical protein